MLQYSGLRIGLLGIVILTQAAPFMVPFSGVRAEEQTSQMPGTPSVETPNDTNTTDNALPSNTDDQTPSTTAPKTKINPPSPRKAALIKELLLVTNQKKSAEQQLEAMLANMEETLPQVLAQIVGARTQLEGDELLQKVTATTQRMVKRYRELLPTRINFGEVTAEISTNLYAKYYTEQELQDLIDFYKTPTGQKAIATLPELTNEALKQSNALLLPEITQLVQEIMKEEFGPEPFKSNPKPKDAPEP